MIKFLNKYKWVITGVILAAVLLVIAFFSGGNVEEAKKQAEVTTAAATSDSADTTALTHNKIAGEATQNSTAPTEAASNSGTTSPNATASPTATSAAHTAQTTTSAQSSAAVEKPTEKTSAPAATVPVTKAQEQKPTEEKPIVNARKRCTISISCATLLNNKDKLDEDDRELVPDDGWILKPTAVFINSNDTVFDVLKRVCKNKKIHMEFSNNPVYDSAYIEGIGNLYEFSAGSNSGWMYRVNGWFPNYGCSQYSLKDGDTIEWMYTCNLGYDIGGSNARGND